MPKTRYELQKHTYYLKFACKIDTYKKNTFIR